jgi:hypothetical protein
MGSVSTGRILAEPPRRAVGRPTYLFILRRLAIVIVLDE